MQDIRNLFRLEGKVALVTGGSRGLGLQVAAALAEFGCRIALTARKADELSAAKESLATKGCEVHTVACDLSKLDRIPALVDEVGQHYGTIDILVNNAGATWGAPAESHPDEAWHKVIDLNVNAPFFLTREVGRRFMIPRRSGKVIVMASAAGLKGTRPGIHTISYNTSKAAVIHFARTLACEWGPHNININAICPGFFPSRLANGLIERFGDEIVARTPLGRIGGDQDLGGLAVFLASDASRHITGQAIVVDGGASLA